MDSHTSTVYLHMSVNSIYVFIKRTVLNTLQIKTC